MPKEVIKEASFKNLKQLEQKSQREIISSKFNPNLTNLQETMEKTFYFNNQSSVSNKENFEDSLNKKKKLSSLINEEKQNNSNALNSSKNITKEKSYNLTKEANNGNLNTSNANAAKSGNEPNNFGNYNTNNFNVNNQNQNNGFYGVNYNNFYANSNIININNFNYPQNFMFQPNMQSPIFPGYEFNTQNSYPGMINHLNNSFVNANNDSKMQGLNNKKNISEGITNNNTYNSEEKTKIISNKIQIKKVKAEKIAVDQEEISNGNLTDYSEENPLTKEDFEKLAAKLDQQESSEGLFEEEEQEEELSVSKANVNLNNSIQQQDANKFNFNFTYNFNNINNPYMPNIPGSSDAPNKFHDFQNSGTAYNNNNSNDPNMNKFGFNSSNNNNFFGSQNSNSQLFPSFGNLSINKSFPNRDYSMLNNNNDPNFPFAGGYYDPFNYSFLNSNNNKYNLNDYNSNKNNSNNSNNNFSNINPNNFPNGSANRNVYNFFSNNNNNDNNSLMNYNIFDMINADSALIFSYFNKLNLNDDSSSYGYKNNNRLLSYYQYKLFDFNGENINFECLNYDQNREKVQLFKEDELEKEKYNIAKTIDEESIEEKIENENFFGPHKGIFNFILFTKESFK